MHSFLNDFSKCNTSDTLCQQNRAHIAYSENLMPNAFPMKYLSSLNLYPFNRERRLRPPLEGFNRGAADLSANLCGGFNRGAEDRFPAL